MSNANHKKKTILRLVQNDPGVGFVDIQKETGYANGVLSHHLKILEKNDHIRIARGKRKIWVFPSHLDSDNDKIRIYIRKETCRRIIDFLLENNESSFVSIQNTIEKSPSTTSTTLKMLVQNDIVKKIPGFPHKYSLIDSQKVLKVIDTIQVSKADTLKDRFADTFSYF
ncbi:MAG: winged helix-turn-helix transcriptional regulator [Nitrosopumilus sp.]